MKTSQIRIIGGDWRGRKLEFPSTSQQLRPTPGNIRETLFNWLAYDIAGARCLDLYAGSGALGVEALSRGAAEVTFVESDRISAHLLQKNLTRLGSKAKVYTMDARRFVRQADGEWDIVFLDPPYRYGMLQQILRLLDEQACLARKALIYIEAERELGEVKLPPDWQYIKRKQASQIAYFLASNNLQDE
ncbi:MAG: 16S rRNA (guanine(966)-N(2))-methyltransferase RsmD [Gammaproteobacteria bacterium]|nr:16S rRNA (guanine(966)-N(2))-methyltransferase RsmD [Gammaproteobacteria bacterium]